MFQKNLSFLYRNFQRSKGFYIINLIGLSTGLACALLIFLWVNDELSFDKFHEKNSRLYQVMEKKEQGGEIVTDGNTSGPVGEGLAQEMPEVEYVVSTRGPVESILSVGEKDIKATGQYAGRDFFNLFSFNLLEGNKENVLKEKNTIVITEELALKLFGSAQNVVGKTIEYQHKDHFTVSGVCQTVPANSSEKFDFILSFELFKDENPWVMDWNNEANLAYVVLKPGTDLDAFNQKIANFIRAKTNNAVKHRTPFLKRYSEKYLYGNYENGVQAGGRIQYVKLFSIIALFIIIIACINFMNLSTAKASKRLKEVGVKKALGASRKDLIVQFLNESLLVAFFSLLVALVLVLLLLPDFNRITGKSLTLAYDGRLIAAALLITCFTGLLAGSYPAFYLSGFNPVVVLKGRINNAMGELWTRKGLVVFQFVLSIILIVSVIVVYKQIEYVQNTNLGYNKDNIVFFKREGLTEKPENLETFLAEVRNLPGVVSASSIGHSMTGHSWSMYGFDWEGKDPNDQTSFENVAVYYDMMETLGIQMKEGRTFSKNFPSDTVAIIFNETAIKHMKLKNPVGKLVNMWGQKMQIIGVAKDFHFESLHEDIKPVMFRLWPSRTSMIMAKIEAGKEKETVEKIDNLHHAFNPGFPLAYKFLDDEYNALYQAERKVSVLSRYFAGLAIVISCLGLFGLAAFTAERRRREISIRKVLGSSELDIVYLLSGAFTKMVIVSIVIALPISFLLLKKWLHNFAFSIDLKWWYFAAAGLLALLVTWFTVGIQAMNAARINPIKSLRSE